MQKTPARSASLDLVPSVASLTALWGVILDTEHTLAGDAPDAAKLSAIASYIDERVPGHQAGRQQPGVAWGSSADEVAGLIAARLVTADGPATAVFARLLRRDIGLHPLGPHVRDPDAAERETLRLHDGDQVYVREGYLLAGTIQCAKTVLKCVPDRIIERAGPGAWARIRAGEPFGAVLEPHGLRRPVREVKIRPGANYPVRSRAGCYLGALPVAIAAEDVPDSLCTWLAAGSRRLPSLRVETLGSLRPVRRPVLRGNLLGVLTRRCPAGGPRYPGH
jgi:hypothetical protein